jgi:hypothetical protein
MRNGEIKAYKGYAIKEETGNSFRVNGFIKKFESYDDAKKAIDYAVTEEKAMRDVENHVQNVCGGWI